MVETVLMAWHNPRLLTASENLHKDPQEHVHDRQGAKKDEEEEHNRHDPTLLRSRQRIPHDST